MTTPAQREKLKELGWVIGEDCDDHEEWWYEETIRITLDYFGGEQIRIYNNSEYPLMDVLLFAAVLKEG